MDTTTFAIRDQGKDRAIVLIHGFSGESHSTFGMMPAFLAGTPEIYEWDIHCFGYPTALRPDVTGVWAADPDLNTLSGFLVTALQDLTFRRYGKLALVGHSMGGLIVERALLDGSFLDRISHTILFGTPSNGLAKTGLGKLFKRQVRDMHPQSQFITRLRLDWVSRIGAHPPFLFRAVAGIRDEFVPRASSVDVFLPEQRAFIGGNHLEIVKPQLRSSDSLELLLGLLGGPAASALKSARVTRAHRDDLWARRDSLTDDEKEQLVYRLEASGREDEAIQLLENISGRSTNLTGVLAGRLKRRWLADPETRAGDGVRARDLYQLAYQASKAAGDHEQAFYNGINDAFMELALGSNLEAAQQIAKDVLGHTKKASGARWARVTQGEAYLYLGADKDALAAYSDALRREWTPRELDSIKRQAIWAARLTNDQSAEEQLEAMFHE